VTDGQHHAHPCLLQPAWPVLSAVCHQVPVLAKFCIFCWVKACAIVSGVSPILFVAVIDAPRSRNMPASAYQRSTQKHQMALGRPGC
jgi:hypothetical protein